MQSSSFLAYCTNVHAGPSLTQVEQNLAHFSAAIRRSLVASKDWHSEETMGVGLWLPASACDELRSPSNRTRLRRCLDEHQLAAWTLNGFPQEDFHQPIVKHRVYTPPWWDTSRYEYTRQLIHILADLLPEGGIGSISTLPIAWSQPEASVEQRRTAAHHFQLLAGELMRLEEETGKQIVLAIEPEPGCIMTDGPSLRRFFVDFLLDGPDAQRVARYITVCYDICHAAVMRESHSEQLAAYAALGLRIGKVQVSSAIQVDWGKKTSDERRETWEHLKGFAEDRYLHQTTTSHASSSREWELHEDLPALMRSIGDPAQLDGVWRIHFHVPIFLASTGRLDTTQSDIFECLQALEAAQSNAREAAQRASPFFTGHLEVETYAWSVMPPKHRGASLIEDIAQEMRFLRHQLKL